MASLKSGVLTSSLLSPVLLTRRSPPKQNAKGASSLLSTRTLRIPLRIRRANSTASSASELTLRLSTLLFLRSKMSLPNSKPKSRSKENSSLLDQRDSGDGKKQKKKPAKRPDAFDFWNNPADERYNRL